MKTPSAVVGGGVEREGERGGDGAIHIDTLYLKLTPHAAVYVVRSKKKSGSFFTRLSRRLSSLVFFFYCCFIVLDQM